MSNEEKGTGEQLPVEGEPPLFSQAEQGAGEVVEATPRDNAEADVAGEKAPEELTKPAAEEDSAEADGTVVAAEALPQEVVEYYEPGAPREVVEVYAREFSLPSPDQPQAKVRKNSRWGVWIFLLCVAVLAGVTIASQLIARQRTIRIPDDSGNYTIEIIQGVGIPTYKPEDDVSLDLKADHGRTLTAQEIYQQLNPAVVTVIVQLKNSGASLGTGVLFTTDGYLLTNYHVVNGGSDCSITLNTGRTLEAKFVAGDSENDIAILKAEGSDLPAAEFGVSDDLEVGDKVYAIGNPLGVELRGTLTDGIVSAINRDVNVDGRTMTLIQTNAALNSGNSGGPLINSYGQVVGINTIKMSSSYSTVEGLGFAIPTSSLQPLVNDLLTYGQIQPQPQIGVSVSQTGTVLPDGTQGIEVQSVTAGSAAEQAGILVGDVVVAADGEEILTSQDLLQVRRRFHVGDEMTMRVYRDGQYLDFTLKLTEAAGE